jgi:hypothetical protein
MEQQAFQAFKLEPRRCLAYKLWRRFARGTIGDDPPTMTRK